MANDEERREPEDLGQDPYVEKLRPDPSQPPEAVRILEGVLGESDREGYRRLYFNRELDHYAEFRTEDVVFSEPIPPDQPPFLGHQATRVGIRRDAPIEFTRLRTPRPVDEFDLDIRLAALENRGLAAAPSTLFDGPCDTPGTVCLGTVCPGTRCEGDTCDTCRTQCGQATCHTCQTCQTRCGQFTCQTCQTCRTQCGQQTCNHDTFRCPTEFGTNCPTCRC